MGKTPKKAAPGGDERNLYVRRLKATTAPSRASESSLPERQREYENLNRLKLAGIQKKITPGPGKNFKSKLRPPSKMEHQTKQHKILIKNPEVKSIDMQSQSEESEVKLNVSIQKENVTEENGNNKAAETEKFIMSKEHIDHTYEKISNELQTMKTVEAVFVAENKTILQEKEGVLLEDVDTKTKEEQEANDIKLIYEAEPISLSNEKEISDDKQPKNNGQGEELLLVPVGIKNGVNEKEEMQSEAATNNESCSVDIVESTTSEISVTSESIIQSDTQKDKESTDDTINDPSFISYDSSIMLKDVQIRLNDCLKDNSKLYDVSNTEDISNQLLKDQSFGRTLRNISGRHSIGRMRHVTLRENRISPNSSLFVNTSSMSTQDEGIESKVLSYGLLSDDFSTNGSPLDRKRRIETENWSSTKKQKTDAESSSIFNTSINLLKGLRMPSMQVSTPKATSYKFETTKLDNSGIKHDDNKMMAEPIESTKKWCVIM